ncbi:hypothetical protein I4U23_022826 [Adineta vaga]|nr:hypothetical protein I4U23_022826 [Adineta vaga]
MSVKLLSMRKISDMPTTENQFIWIYRSDNQWIPFSETISSIIEEAFRSGSNEIFIEDIYRIDLNYFVKENIANESCKHAIGRRLRQNAIDSSIQEDEWRRCERFLFPLESVSNCSATIDTKYYGSPFIEKWFLIFTKGKHTVTFNFIFPCLIQGLQEEGRNEPKHILESIINTLEKVKNKTIGKNEKKRMKELENCCAMLYTKPYFIYRTVNTALRDNDQTKLLTIGPYCFLVFNYIGRHINEPFSIHRHIQSKIITVFRGDYISEKMLEEYRHAVGNNSKYFKWLPFVSTSYEKDVAENFARNVLYIMKIRRHSSNDLYADMSTISSFKDEKEIILQPGIRFQVENIELDFTKKFYLIYIHIIPSYVSTLK